MAVENHPLFPTWKAALEELIRTKKLLESASGTTERLAAREAHAHALGRYAQIADEI